MFAIDPDSLLANHLRVYRGGNKDRLVARCYVASVRRLPSEAQDSAIAYETFRAVWRKKTYAALHEEFDAILPLEHRSK